MATGKCPSCQTPVSDTATTCPHCGYRDDKSGTSIISSPRTPAHPAWHTTAVPSDPDRRLIDILTSTSRIQLAEELLQAAPAFAEAVRSLLPETVKIAHIPDEMQHLINNGQLAFRFDKNGEMLAQLTKGDGLVSNNLRLRNLTLTPEFGLSIVNLQMQLTMMQVVSELHDVKQGIDELRAGLHDDRLATVDSAKQQFSQAMSISGARLREMKFLDVLQRTTDAKCQLMRTFERDYAEFEKQRSQSPLARMMDQNASKKGDTNSIEMLKSLAAIVEASRIETISYTLLKEREAARVSIQQLSEFAATNNLHDRNTLLRINSFAQTSQETWISSFLDALTYMKSLETTSRTYRPALEASIKNMEDHD